jgi:acetyl esterase/lipase
MRAYRYVSFFLILTYVLFLITGCTPEVTSQTTTTAADINLPLDPAKLGTVDRDITYATIDGVAIKMDIYYPRSADKAVPLVLYVHGGSWAGGDKSSAGSIYIPDLVAGGYMVASINYRLAPDYKIQSQIEDVNCAVMFLKAHAAEYGIDKAHIGAIGDSAGAHLVALLGTSDASAGLEGSGGYNDRSSRVQAVIDLFGPTDLYITS